MRFRIALGGPRPTIETAEFAEARDRRQVEAAALEMALSEEVRLAMSLDSAWQDVEDYVAAHGAHGELKLFEDYRWNKENSTLCERVCVSIGCSEHSDRLERFVIPPSAVPSRDLVEPVARLRAELDHVVSTGLRPARALDERSARWRRVHTGDFVRHHRAHGGLQTGEGQPTRLGFVLEDPVEIINRAWVRCVCGATSSWSAETPEKAEQILAELRAVAG